MAREKLTPEEQFVVRSVKQLTEKQVIECASLLLSNNINKLDLIRRDRHSSALQVWIAEVAKKGIKHGDMQSLDALLTRVIGKPKQTIQLQGDPEAPIVTTTMTREERRAEIERLSQNRMIAGDD